MKKNLITALKKLVTSFGGEAESNNAVDLVDEFADVAAQGGSSGGGSLSIEYFTDAETGDLACTKTYSEIIAALEAGKSIHAENGYVDYGTTRMSVLGDGVFSLVFFDGYGVEISQIVFLHYYDGVIGMYKSTIQSGH